MSELTLNLLGFPAANKDLTVELRDPSTQRIIKSVQPFLDGTVRVPDIGAGAYEMRVTHPNLTLPVITRPIRIFPTGPTKVSVVIDPSRFRNTPIEDIPEANLTPIADLAGSIGETVAPLAAKKPGEAILAQDWNTLAGGLHDLSGAVRELTRVVTPTGHDHPEYLKKFDEITQNFQTLLETVSSSLAELQRQIQTQRLRNHIVDVLDAASIDPNSTKGRELTDIVRGIESQVTASPATFGRELRNASTQIESKLNALLQENQANDAFVQSDAVKNLSTAVDLAKANRATTYEAELLQFKKMDRTLGSAFQSRR